MKLTTSQKALRRDFRRGMRIVILGGSKGVVRGYKGEFVLVLLEGPTVSGMALATRRELTK